MTDYSDLIARLEKATEGDRRLDAEIAAACGARPDWLRSDDRALVASGKFGHVSAGKSGPGFEALLYTSSVDAALALVPEGWRVGFEDAAMPDTVQAPLAYCWPFDNGWEPDWRDGQDGYRDHPLGVRAFGATRTLAICLAAIRARSAGGR